jgi:hypothetical protein
MKVFINHKIRSTVQAEQTMEAKPWCLKSLKAFICSMDSSCIRALSNRIFIDHLCIQNIVLSKRNKYKITNIAIALKEAYS